MAQTGCPRSPSTAARRTGQRKEVWLMKRKSKLARRQDAASKRKIDTKNTKGFVAIARAAAWRAGAAEDMVGDAAQAVIVYVLSRQSRDPGYEPYFLKAERVARDFLRKERRQNDRGGKVRSLDDMRDGGYEHSSNLRWAGKHGGFTSFAFARDEKAEGLPTSAMSVLAAVHRAGGITEGAAALGVSPRTMMRGIKAEVAAAMSGQLVLPLGVVA